MVLTSYVIPKYHKTQEEVNKTHQFPDTGRNPKPLPVWLYKLSVEYSSRPNWIVPSLSFNNFHSTKFSYIASRTCLCRVTLPVRPNLSPVSSLRHWRWRQRASPERWLLPTSCHGALTGRDIIRMGTNLSCHLLTLWSNDLQHSANWMMCYECIKERNVVLM
jgi:hypothetical protein